MNPAEKMAIVMALAFLPILIWAIPEAYRVWWKDRKRKRRARRY